MKWSVRFSETVISDGSRPLSSLNWRRYGRWDSTNWGDCRVGCQASPYLTAPANSAPGVAAHPYRYVAVSDRLGREVYAVEVVMLSVELRLVVAPQRPEYLKILVRDRPPVRVGCPQDVELLLQPSDADAAHSAALRENVQRGEHLGLQYRVAIRNYYDRAAYEDSLGRRGYVAQRNQRVQLGVVRAGDEAAVRGVRVLVGLLGGQDYVVAHPDRLEAQFLDRPGEAQQGVAVRGLRQRESVFHAKPPYPNIAANSAAGDIVSQGRRRQAEAG